MREVRIFILWVDDVFKDVFASYSEATRESGRYTGKVRIEERRRMDY